MIYYISDAFGIHYCILLKCRDSPCCTLKSSRVHRLSSSAAAIPRVIVQYLEPRRVRLHIEYVFTALHSRRDQHSRYSRYLRNLMTTFNERLSRYTESIWIWKIDETKKSVTVGYFPLFREHNFDDTFGEKRIERKKKKNTLRSRIRRNLNQPSTARHYICETRR